MMTCCKASGLQFKCKKGSSWCNGSITVADKFLLYPIVPIAIAIAIGIVIAIPYYPRKSIIHHSDQNIKEIVSHVNKLYTDDHLSGSILGNSSPGAVEARPTRKIFMKQVRIGRSDHSGRCGNIIDRCH